MGEGRDHTTAGMSGEKRSSPMTGKGGFPEGLQYMSASRWASEALFGVESAPFAHVMSVERTAHDLGFNVGRFGLDMFLMFIIGIYYRLIAYAIMRFADRKLLRAY